MPLNEWKINHVPFTDLLQKIIDNRGKTCPTSETGIALIATNCIKNENLYPVYEKVRYIEKETYKNWFRSHPEPGDIIFVTKGTPGRVCIVPDPVDFCIAQDMVAVRADEKKIYPHYLFAALRSSSVQRNIENMHVGSLIPHFKKGDFGKLLIPIPNKVAQKQIGDFYYNLSCKIELNRQMNKTLEDMAQAIFKSWFVDFDPVKAKAEGRKIEGLSQEILELFPDSFETYADKFKNILLPKNWKVLKLGSILDVKHGYAFKSNYYTDEQNNNILLTPGNFNVGGGFKPDKFRYYNGEVPNDYILKHNDLIITMTDLSKNGDTLGYPALIPCYNDRNFLHNQRIGKIIFKQDDNSKFFFYFLFMTDIYRHEVLSTATGSTVRHTSPDRIKAFEFILPDGKILNLYSKIVESLMNKIDLNNQEVQTLSDMRDTLLPQLISGDLRIPDAQKLLEGVI